MSKKILITPRSLSNGEHTEFKPLFDAGYEIVTPTPGKMPTETDLIASLKDCEGWLAGVEPVSKKVINAAPYLKVISRNGTGIDNLPLDLLKERGIAVERAVGTNARGVAELAITFILAGLRQLIFTHEGIRNNEWPRMRGREICDITVGVIGLGSIGRISAELCLALGAEVIGYDPFAPDDIISHKHFTRVNFIDVIKKSNAITLHAPMPEDGKALISADILNQVKPELILVNTARAGLVDEDAIVAALNKRRIGCYLTDVFHTEPPNRGALTQNPFVTMTSHIGGLTDSSISRSTEVAVANLLKVLL